MPEMRYVQHEGQSVLLMDFTNISDYSVMPVLIDEATTLATTSGNPHTVLALIDLTGTRLSKGVTSSLSRLSRNNGPYIKAIALVGLNKHWSFFVSTF